MPDQIDQDTSVNDPSEPQVEEELTPWTPITQSHPSGLTATWLAYGAHLHSQRLADGTSVLLGYDQAEGHQGGSPYLGGMIGPVANRIANAQFSIDGTEYALEANEGINTLHGGPTGFDRVFWDVTRDDDALIFRHTASDGQGGFPGHLDVSVRSQMSEDSLELTIIAFTDTPTPVNITHHGYWNPSGLFDQSIDNLRLTSPADRYVEPGEGLIPTGQTPSVEGTIFDFREERSIGPGPIDIALLVPGEGLREMARLTDGLRTVRLFSDYPSVQLYTGENLTEIPRGVARSALAIEAQYPPNAVNQAIDGHDTILRPGDVYRHRIIYKFEGPDLDNDQP